MGGAHLSTTGLAAVKRMIAGEKVDQKSSGLNPREWRELMAALDFVQEVASRPELRVTFTLEPGEILFWHNFTLLHARTAFANSEDRKRLLLRLWLNVPNGRAMHFTFNERARNLDRMNEEAATQKPPA